MSSFASLWYKYFDLGHVSKVAAHFQKKNKMFICSLKYLNKKNENIYKKRGCRDVFRTLKNVYDGVFLQKYNG